MHKFKVGDVVRLKTVKELDEEFGDGWRSSFWVLRSMESQHLGNTVTIRACEYFESSPRATGYFIHEDYSRFYCEELFVDPNEELTAISMDFSFDDLIK